MPVQTSYSLEHSVALPGLIADLGLQDILSGVVETAVIGFGLAVVQGTADNQVILPSGGGDDFRGIAIRQLNEVANASDVAEYAVSSELNYMRTGRTWVICEDGCVPGAPALWRHTAPGSEVIGALRTDSDGGDAAQIAGASFRTTASAGAIALLELNIPGSGSDIAPSTAETLVAAGAASLLTNITYFDSTAAAMAVTLADGVES